MDVRPHQHPVVRSHAEEGDEAHPDRHAEVDGMHLEEIPHVLTGDAEIHEPRLPVEPQQDEPAREGDKHTGEMDQRSRHRAELEVEHQQHDEQSQRDDNHQPVRSTLLLLVVPGKLIRDALGQHQFAALHLGVEHRPRLVHHVHLGTAGELVEDDVAHQERVFALDHLRAARIFDVRQLLERHLRPGGGGNEQHRERLRTVAQLTGIAQPDGETLAAFHRAGERHPSHGSSEHLLQVTYRYTVACH